jgi:hypothetical protein
MVPPHGSEQPAGVTVQDWFVYEPESVPLLQVRVWEVQVAGDTTEDD